MYKSLLAVSLLMSFNLLAQSQNCLQSHLLKVNTTSEFDFNGKNVTRHKLEAYVSTKKVDSSAATLAHQQWWGVQLTDVKQLGNGELMPEDSIYSLPFAVLRGVDGQLVDFKFPVTLKDSEQDKLKGLAYYLQFVDGDVTPKTRSEIDTIGTSTVEYQKSLDKQGLTQLDKRKLSYVFEQNQGDTAALSTVDILESQHNITLSECWFESLRGNEKLNFNGAGDSYTMTTSQRYSLSKVAKPVQSLLAQLPQNIDQWHIGEEPVALTEQELAALAEEFKAQLNAIPILDFRASELATWLEKFDAVIAVLGQLFIENTFSDEINMRLFNALGHLDTANGNQLLMQLMSSEELDETQRFRAMRAITTGTKPLTAELTEQMLNLLVNDNFPGSASLRGASLMALGAVIKRRQMNQYSQELLTEISNRVSPSTPDNERAALIASIGNAGQPESITLLRRYQQDQLPRVRANVATSLGQIGTEKAHEALSEMLYSETDARSQQAVFSAIGQFKLSAQDINQITTAAQTSKSERTRSQAIKALANQKHDKENVQISLRKMMKSERSRKNFTLAAKALTQLQKDDGNG